MAKTKIQKQEGTVATVLSKTGGVIRTYSLEVHGDTFAESAKEMAAQHPDSTVSIS